jgi:hypothetical protein
MSIESIVNQSLDLIGYKRHVGSIWDGSPAARVALNAYAETRDEVLAAKPWPFARDFATLELVTGPPPYPWLYRYKWPLQAIRLLDVFPSTLTLDDALDPTPTRWLEVHDGIQEGQHGILTSFSPAMAAVTWRVTDPGIWPPDFTHVVIQSLAEKLARALVGGGGGEKQDEAGRRSQ